MSLRRLIFWTFAVAAINLVAVARANALELPPSHPVVTVAASAPAPADAPLVIWISGDGGWGKMEKEVTSRLAARGVTTIGLDSLRYFIRNRPPEEAARMVAGLARKYAATAGARDIVVVGFSFGADIGPFVVKALPPDVRARVRLAAFLSPSEKANLRVSPASWLGIGTGPPVGPVLHGLAPTPVLCIGGAGIFDDICGPDAHTPHFRVVRLGGGHTMSGRYDAITSLLLDPLNGNRAP